MTEIKITRWKEEEDLKLVDIILQHVRNGETLIEAYDEAERVLSRSAAACKFRWTTELKEKYETAIEQAKLQAAVKREKVEEVEKQYVQKKNPPLNQMAEALQKINIQKKIEESPRESSSFQREELNNNPFFMIKRFVNKMEQQFGDVFGEIERLKKEITSLKQTKEHLEAHNSELLTQFQHATQKIMNMKKEHEDECTTLNTEIERLKQEIDSYKEIQQLIQQFHSSK